uniref:DNA repair protein RAD51 homolog 3 n=1 Tax=Mesocestoides corti TaxID=53468 RepID=A0A5K3F0C5_MESCO
MTFSLTLNGQGTLMLSDPDFRELVTLPLPTLVLRAFSKAGYTSVGEVCGLTVEQIASVCHLPRSKAASVADIIQTYSSLNIGYIYATGHCLTNNLFYPHSALHLLHHQSMDLSIPERSPATGVLTMSKNFDDLLDGGFPCGRITEICGQPGVGKTQFCLQTCLTVQLPNWCGGLFGEAVFIDTEGNFMPKRLLQMAADLVKHCQAKIAPRVLQYIDSLGETAADAEEKAACLEALSELPTEDSLLSRIHYIRCTDYLRLLRAVRLLGEFCRYHTNVRLIVVDSIALPFRYEFDDIPQRNRLLAALSQSLLALAGSQNAAVIVTNQITTRIHQSTDFSTTNNSASITSANLVPALGDSWGHICSVRLFLSKVDDFAGEHRTARLLKHPGRPPGTATYQVTVRC